MVGTAVTQKTPVSLRRENQVQAMGDEEASDEVISEEVVTKYMADESDASNAQNTHHQSETSK